MFYIDTDLAFGRTNWRKRIWNRTPELCREFDKKTFEKQISNHYPFLSGVVLPLASKCRFRGYGTHTKPIEDCFSFSSLNILGNSGTAKKELAEWYMYLVHRQT